jgi:DNA-binding HxlR family transcriptional regulator
MPTEKPDPQRIEFHASPTVGEMLESIVGCKWSLHVLGCIRSGVSRPGAIERKAPGLSAKVLNERLAKLQRFGIIDRTVFAESPPRVEYRLTPFGSRFVGLIDAVESLQRELTAGGEKAAGSD